MDYKEEYQNALERAKMILCNLPEGSSSTRDIETIFPELKETEDERIRKELIKEIEFIIPHECETDSEGLILSSYHARIDKYRAYLEKQIEQKRIVPEREATDFEIEVHEIIAQARSDKRLADKDVLEQFEKEASCALMWKAEKQLRNAKKA